MNQQISFPSWWERPKMYKGHTYDTTHLDIHGLCISTCERYKLRPNWILDVGAYEGEGVIALGEKISSCKHYTLIEPSKKSFRVIEKLLSERENKAIKCDAYECVLSDIDGSVEFYEHPDAEQSSNMFTHRGNSYGSVIRCDVKAMDFRNLLKDKKVFDFVKMNIEGAEYDLMRNGFFDHVNAFLIEVHNQHAKKADGEYYTVLDALNMLGESFEMVTHGILQHKHCFVSGVRINGF